MGSAEAAEAKAVGLVMEAAAAATDSEADLGVDSEVDSVVDSAAAAKEVEKTYSFLHSCLQKASEARRCLFCNSRLLL